MLGKKKERVEFRIKMIQTSKITVLIVDDHTVVRQGLGGMLAQASHIEVLAQAADGQEAIYLSHTLKPDVVLMDLQMPRMDGLQATKKILAQNKDTRVIILTVLEKVDYLQQAVAAGASGYLIKNTSAAELVRVIESVATGGSHFNQSLSLVLTPPQASLRDPVLFGSLSNKEVQVLHLMLQGHKSSEIAQKLARSPRTVRIHQQNIRKKCGVQNDTQLVLLAKGPHTFD